MNAAGAPPVKFKIRQLDCTACERTPEGTLSCTCKVPVQEVSAQKPQSTDDLRRREASSHYSSDKAASPSEDLCKDAQIKFDVQEGNWMGPYRNEKSLYVWTGLIAGAFDLSDPDTRTCYEYCTRSANDSMSIESNSIASHRFGEGTFFNVRNRCLSYFAEKNAQNKSEHSVLRAALTLAYRINSLTRGADLILAAGDFLDIGRNFESYYKALAEYWKEGADPNNLGRMIKFTGEVRAKLGEAIDSVRAQLEGKKVTAHFGVYESENIDKVKDLLTKEISSVLKLLGLHVDLELEGYTINTSASWSFS